MKSIAYAVLALALSGCGKDARQEVPQSAPVALKPAPEFCLLEDCARAWGMSLRRESARSILSGKDRELVCCPGMRSALLDGAPVRLEAPAEIREGRLAIPASLRAEAEKRWNARPPVTQAPAKGTPAFRILIDAGHGGCLTGAQGCAGTLEKTVNLQITRLLQAELETRGAQVDLIRDCDCAFFPPALADGAYKDQQRSDLEERVRRANLRDADLFVSVHANWAPSPDAEGFEVYYPRSPGVPELPAAPSRKRSGFDWSAYGGETPRILEKLALADREQVRWKSSRDLAESVRRALRGALSTPDRGARMADFKVIRETRVPAILVETGFLSHPGEEKRLASPDYQKRVALALADGIEAYLRARR